MGKVSDRRHDSMVALVGELEGMRVPQGRIPQGVVKEMPSYELFKYGSGTLLLLREGGLFVRVDGENDATKEVRIPGEEGPAVLRAVISGQAPEGIASSDRVRYIEVKRAVKRAWRFTSWAASLWASRGIIPWPCFLPEVISLWRATVSKCFPRKAWEESTPPVACTAFPASSAGRMGLGMPSGF